MGGWDVYLADVLEPTVLGERVRVFVHHMNSHAAFHRVVPQLLAIVVERADGAVALLEEKALVLGLGAAVGIELLLDSINLVDRWVGGWVGDRKVEENGAVRMCCWICRVWVGGWVGWEERRTVVWRSRRMSGMETMRLEWVTPTITTPWGKRSYRVLSPATR